MRNSTSAIAPVWRTWFNWCRWWNVHTCRVIRTPRRRASISEEAALFAGTHRVGRPHGLFGPVGLCKWRCRETRQHHETYSQGQVGATPGPEKQLIPVSLAYFTCELFLLVISFNTSRCAMNIELLAVPPNVGFNAVTTVFPQSISSRRVFPLFCPAVFWSV